MKNQTGASEPESYPMTGGDGVYSYAKNSRYQRDGATGVKPIVDEVIAKSLDVEKLSSISNTFCLADLGCSTGPNTFVHMQDLIDSVARKYLSQGTSDKLPEFHVFFSDHSLNDFNTLFTSLPPERQYFAAGVPGSFYGRLFPNSSLHLVYSSYALQWMSMSPQQCNDANASAYNKGHIHYSGAPSVVGDAYAAQFANDMDTFLKARAKEITIGGMMVMVTCGRLKDVPHTDLLYARTIGLMESVLLDMVKMEMINESELDSLNIPLYFASPEEMTMAVKKNGDFSIEKLELTYSNTGNIDLQTLIMTLGAGLKPLFSKHFGSEIIDELFDRFSVKIKERPDEFETTHLEKNLLLVILKKI